MSRLVLIRHGKSQVDPESAPATWGLTDVGRVQVRSLADALDNRDIVAIGCGDEPKMVESMLPLAEAAQLTIEVSAAFRESHSEGWFEIEHLDGIVADFFRNPRVGPAPGWEPAREAAQRFLAGVRELTAGHDKGAVAICSGGRVLTAVLDQLGLLRPEAAFETWRETRMPDVAVVEVNGDAEPVLLRPFGWGDLPPS